MYTFNNRKNKKVYVENHSLSIGTNSNKYTNWDKYYDDSTYNSGVVMFASAGNSYPYVGSPGKALNVITVGSYDDSSNMMSPTSSYLNSEIGNQKPEIVAPGVNIDVAGQTGLSGTSFSSPHAAGFAADLMSKYSWFKGRPYYMKAKMIAGATDKIDGGYNKTGAGGINFSGAVYNGVQRFYEGSNAYFQFVDQGYDDNLNNGYIDWDVDIPAGVKTRIVISWSTRGTYTYDNRKTTEPLGADYDLKVKDPNGNLVTPIAPTTNPAHSRRNSFEVIDFISTGGIHTIQIEQYTNNDSSLRMQMGVVVEWL